MNVYLVDINDFSYLEGLELLSEKRRKRVERYCFLDDKKRCLIGGLLFRYVLKEAEREVVEDENGKPYLPNGKVKFNLAHAGKYVVLGVSNGEIGVDIEDVREYIESVATECFLSQEREFIYSSDNPNQTFFRLWTAKESVTKLFGLGLKMNPNSFSVLPMTDGQRRINARDLFLKWINYDGHIIAISSFDSADITLIKLEKSQLL